MRVRKPSYFVPISFGAGGAWGSGPDSDTAIKNAMREARSFAKALGGFARGVRLDFIVYSLPEGTYAYSDERGVFEVDYETDVIQRLAEPAYFYRNASPHRPFTTMEMHPVAEAFAEGGLEARRAFSGAPIGEEAPS